MSKRTKNSGLTFVLRESDLRKRLSSGYWFLGNDDYIALSFWSGTDWVRKVPNISLILFPKLSKAVLEISVKDSEEKQRLIEEVFKGNFKIEKKSAYLFSLGEYHYGADGEKDFLNKFLAFEKNKIDNIIDSNINLFKTRQNPQNQIGYISEDEFLSNAGKIKKYRKLLGSDNLPVSIASISIKNFGPIKNITFDEIPNNCQWIFLTGENGSGKTSILRAIAVAILDGNTISYPKGDTEIEIAFYKNKKLVKAKKIIRPERISNKLNILTSGFAAFGPFRLNILEQKSDSKKAEYNDVNEVFRKPHLPLFITSGHLIDISTVYNNPTFRNHQLFNNDKRLRNIVQVVTSICDKIVDVHFGKYMMYFEADDQGKLYGNGGTPFRQLASGYRSIIAMVNHMMLHLYYQQPEIEDPSELKGVVIIDEIDLHFHPKMQRDLVIKLTEIFPRIQFIVSTHSPIPLLGAPENAIVFTAKRDKNQGVHVERLQSGISFTDLLPNSILTSPIFGLDEIIPEGHDEKDPLFTEDSYDEVVFNKILEEKIREISKI